MASHRELRSDVDAALGSYCRGIDRLNAEAVRAAFHPGALLIDYGPEPTTIEAFIERALSALRTRFDATQHRVSNITVDRRGDDLAVVETYVLAFHVQPGDGDDPDRLHTFNGRYIDRFEVRGGPWLIAERTLRVDWSRVETIEETMGGSWVPSGRAGSPDPFDP